MADMTGAQATIGDTYSDFRYDQLEPSKEEIRLVKSIPQHLRSAQAPLQFQIQTFELASCPEYQALSYTWGSADDVETIIVNEAQLLIRRNLFNFLGQLDNLHAPINAPRLYWVDRVCVDQTNIEERNHQVGLMQKIYTNAVAVHAWLGDSNNDDDVLACILHGPTTHWPIIPMSSRATASLEHIDLLNRVTEFCRRPYWTRLWIVQELGLAREIIFWCGNHHDTLRTEPLSSESILYSWAFIKDDQEHIDAVRALLEASIGSRDIAFSATYESNNTDTIRRRKTLSDLYGLLSLIEPEQRLKVDYSIRPETVFEESLEVLIRYDDILSQEGIALTRYVLWLLTRYEAADVRALKEALLGEIGHNTDSLVFAIRALCWSNCSLRVANDPDIANSTAWWSDGAYIWSTLAIYAVTPKQKSLALELSGQQIQEERKRLLLGEADNEMVSSRVDVQKLSIGIFMDVADSHGFLIRDGFLLHPEENLFSW